MSTSRPGTPGEGRRERLAQQQAQQRAQEELDRKDQQPRQPAQEGIAAPQAAVPQAAADAELQCYLEQVDKEFMPGVEGQPPFARYKNISRLLDKEFNVVSNLEKKLSTFVTSELYSADVFIKTAQDLKESQESQRFRGYSVTPAPTTRNTSDQSNSRPNAYMGSNALAAHRETFSALKKRLDDEKSQFVANVRNEHARFLKEKESLDKTAGNNDQAIRDLKKYIISLIQSVAKTTYEESVRNQLAVSKTDKNRSDIISDFLKQFGCVVDISRDAYSLIYTQGFGEVIGGGPWISDEEAKEARQLELELADKNELLSLPFVNGKDATKERVKKLQKELDDLKANKVIPPRTTPNIVEHLVQTKSLLELQEMFNQVMTATSEYCRILRTLPGGNAGGGQTTWQLMEGMAKKLAKDGASKAYFTYSWSCGLMVATEKILSIKADTTLVENHRIIANKNKEKIELLSVDFNRALSRIVECFNSAMAACGIDVNDAKQIVSIAPKAQELLTDEAKKIWQTMQNYVQRIITVKALFKDVEKAATGIEGHSLVLEQELLSNKVQDGCFDAKSINLLTQAINKDAVNRYQQMLAKAKDAVSLDVKGGDEAEFSVNQLAKLTSERLTEARTSLGGSVYSDPDGSYTAAAKTLDERREKLLEREMQAATELDNALKRAERLIVYSESAVAYSAMNNQLKVVSSSFATTKDRIQKVLDAPAAAVAKINENKLADVKAIVVTAQQHFEEATLAFAQAGLDLLAADKSKEQAKEKFAAAKQQFGEESAVAYQAMVEHANAEYDKAVAAQAAVEASLRTAQQALSTLQAYAEVAAQCGKLSTDIVDLDGRSKRLVEDCKALSAIPVEVKLDAKLDDKVQGAEIDKRAIKAARDIAAVELGKDSAATSLDNIAGSIEAAADKLRSIADSKGAYAPLYHQELNVSLTAQLGSVGCDLAQVSQSVNLAKKHYADALAIPAKIRDNYKNAIAQRDREKQIVEYLQKFIDQKVDSFGNEIHVGGVDFKGQKDKKIQTGLASIYDILLDQKKTPAQKLHLVSQQVTQRQTAAQSCFYYFFGRTKNGVVDKFYKALETTLSSGVGGFDAVKEALEKAVGPVDTTTQSAVAKSAAKQPEPESFFYQRAHFRA
jgi:hypothetical protein